MIWICKLNAFCFQIHLQRSSRIKEENSSLSNDTHDIFPDDLPLVLKSKLLIVDLAGSERIDKSGKASLHILSFQLQIKLVTEYCHKHVHISKLLLLSQEVKVT